MRQAGMLATVLLAMSAAAVAQDGGDGWKQRYRQATGHQFGCFGEAADKECRALIAGYESAMAAPDANDSVRHALFREYQNAQAVYGGKLRQRGDLEGAFAVLDRGYRRMMDHFDGGKHFHTLIDNLRLQSELIQTLILLDQHDDLATLIGNARTGSDSVYESFAAAAGNEHKLQLQHSNLVGSEDLESGLAATLAAHAAELQAQGKSTEATKLRTLSVEAYGRAKDWLERSTAAGVQGAMDPEPAMRVSELQRGLGDVLQAGGDRKAAVQAYLYAGAHSCGLLKPGTQEQVQAGRQLAPDQYLAFNECKRAADAYLVASGELERMVKDRVDALYKEQMSLLEVDLKPLLRATRPVQD